MLKIGLRTIKTAVAILICLILFIILKCFELIPGVSDKFAITWYNPFFAALATAYSVQSSKAQSLAQAKNRCIASVIGGSIAIALIYIYELCGGIWPALVDVNLASLNFIIPYILISLFSILVVILGILFRQPQAIFVSLLTFLSITINPGTAMPNWEFQFGINRILSTVIGVLVALGVNFMRMPHLYKNKNILFCIGMEGILKNDSDDFRGYLRYKLNSFNEEGLDYTFFTTRTPSTFMDLAINYNLTKPIICMSGAALYDPVNKHYLGIEGFNQEESREIRGFFKEYGITPFMNIIANDSHYIYSSSIDNEAEALYESLKINSGFCNYINKDLDINTPVLYFLLLEDEKVVDDLVKALNESNLKDKIIVQVYSFLNDSIKSNNLKYIKIYSKRILGLEAFKSYKEDNEKKVISLLTDDNTYPMLDLSDYVLTIPSASKRILDKADLVIPNDKYETVFKEMHRLYYKKINNR